MTRTGRRRAFDTRQALARALAAAADGFVEIVTAAMARGQATGEVTASATPEAQARLLLLLFQGAALMSRSLTAGRRSPGPRPPVRRYGLDAAVDGSLEIREHDVLGEVSEEAGDVNPGSVGRRSSTAGALAARRVLAAGWT